MRKAVVLLVSTISISLPGFCSGVAGQADQATQVEQGDKANEARYFDSYIRYLDHLKTCTPYTWSYEHLPANPQVSGKNIIKGLLQGNCFVTEFQYIEGHESEPTKQQCEYSPESIAFMTSKAMYEDARTRESGGPKPPSNAEVEAARRSIQECTQP